MEVSAVQAPAGQPQSEAVVHKHFEPAGAAVQKQIRMVGLGSAKGGDALEGNLITDSENALAALRRPNFGAVLARLEQALRSTSDEGGREGSPSRAATPASSTPLGGRFRSRSIRRRRATTKTRHPIRRLVPCRCPTCFSDRRR